MRVVVLLLCWGKFMKMVVLLLKLVDLLELNMKLEILCLELQIV